MHQSHSISLFLLFFSWICVHVYADARVKEEHEHMISRLAKIEATLEIVLEHNKQMEKRIELLEDENMALKKSLSAIDVQSLESDPERRGSWLDKYTWKRKSKIVTTADVKFKPKRQLNEATAAFTAVVSPPALTNVGAGQTIIFDAVITNIGNVYHNTTGVFTAPVSGAYVFSFSEMIDPGKNEYLELVKEGQHIIWNYGHSNGATHLVSSTRLATVELKRGEMVWVRTHTGSNQGDGEIHGNGFTSFSGWLIAVFD